MSEELSDTVFALSSGSNRAGVAVIRVSGIYALKTAEILSDDTIAFTPRMATLAPLRDPETKAPIDKALCLYLKAPASYTGEDTIEFHVHGGVSVVNALLSALTKMPGCRMAEPGEFTRRAFENGKLDLTEAEAVADLIAAETEAQRLQALDQLGGQLSRLYTGWADRLKKILAHQEADLEFPEDDLPDTVSQKLQPEIKQLINELTDHLNDNRRGEILRNGVSIAIIGAPNAGKSSLMNALAERDVAIVSDTAGTTRDVIEVKMDLGGYPVSIADTAGLRETEDAIEAEGVRRAKGRAGDADLKIALFDARLLPEKDSVTQSLCDDKTLVVYNKIDCVENSTHIPDDGFKISATTGEGLSGLLQALTENVRVLLTQKDTPPLTRQRHRAALQDALQHLEQSLSVDLPELAAEDLRLALRAIGKITGRIHVEDLLDVIFKDFCIGK